MAALRNTIFRRLATRSAVACVVLLCLASAAADCVTRAIARAVYRDPDVLILDEATSALDSEVEAAIRDTLYGVMEGKTVIAIAHRLSTIARMDRILVLDGGRIVEDGSHDALLTSGGLYARFWDRQSGGFLNTTEAAE